MANVKRTAFSASGVGYLRYQVEFSSPADVVPLDGLPPAFTVVAIRGVANAGTVRPSLSHAGLSVGQVETAALNAVEYPAWKGVGDGPILLNMNPAGGCTSAYAEVVIANGLPFV